MPPFNLAPYNHINSISPDKKRFFFISAQGEQPTKAWVVDKTENGWGEPRLLRLNTIDNPCSEGKAIEHCEKFLDLWKDADPGIAEAADARERPREIED